MYGNTCLSTTTMTKIIIIIVRTKFEIPAQDVQGLRPKKLKNNEFVKNGLEHWALMNQTTSQVGLVTEE